jgi:hypothetical protein
MRLELFSLTIILTNSKKQSMCWETDSYADRQKITSIPCDKIGS